jgi:hypothetical protein
MKRYAGLLATAVLFAGCATGPNFSMQSVDAMRPGVTTYTEAQRTLGQPTNVIRDADGTIRAGWARGESWGIFSSTRAVIIHFGPDGRMLRVANRGQSGWTPGS